MTLSDIPANRNLVKSQKPSRGAGPKRVEFDTAVVTLERNGRASIRTEYEERVFVSAYQVMRQRLNIPDNASWEGPSDRELAEFLRGIDGRQRRLLKQIAEGLD